MAYPIEPRLTNARAPSLSIIVPVLDEAAIIVGALQDLAKFRERGAEVIVVDGGSRDGTPGLARPHADDIVTAARGRGAQMNAGAAEARGEVLLFLHADTKLPPEPILLLDSFQSTSSRPSHIE